MSGLGPDMDFFDELRDESSYLAPTFYAAVGIVATLVIIIVILIIGYCYFARYLVMRNRLMNRYCLAYLNVRSINVILPCFSLFSEYTGK